MESLLITTDSKIVHPDHAKFVSRLLLSGEDYHHHDCRFRRRLQNCLVRYILQEPSKHQLNNCIEKENCDQIFVSVSNYDDHGYADNDYGNYSSREMQILALRVLANALEQEGMHSHSLLLRDNKDNDDNDSKKETLNNGHQSLLCESITKSLINNLSDASEKPDKAALSAKCLRFLLTNDIMKHSNMTVSDNVLESAYKYGKAHHLCLEKETSSLMEYLEIAS